MLWKCWYLLKANPRFLFITIQPKQANLVCWQCKLQRKESLMKGTVSVNSSDSPFRDGNARFTTVPLKALSDEAWARYSCFCLFKLLIGSFFAKVNFRVRKWRYLSQFWSDLDFKGLMVHYFSTRTSAHINSNRTSLAVVLKIIISWELTGY